MPSSLRRVLPRTLGFSPRLPVSVLVRAHFTSLEAFLGSVVRLNLFIPKEFLSIGSRPLVRGFASTPAYRLRRTFPIVRSSSLLRHSILKRFHAVQEFLPVVHRLCLLPRLRSRLTLGRRALPRIPGLGPDLPWDDERCPGSLRLSVGQILTDRFATHTSILTSKRSSCPYGQPSTPLERSPTQTCVCHDFGSVLEPRIFSAQGLSTSELLRTL